MRQIGDFIGTALSKFADALGTNLVLETDVTQGTGTMLRFTIRDVALLIALAAISFCWWKDRSRITQKLEETQMEVTRISADTLEKRTMLRMTYEKLRPGTKVLVEMDERGQLSIQEVPD